MNHRWIRASAIFLASAPLGVLPDADRSACVLALGVGAAVFGALVLMLTPTG